MSKVIEAAMFRAQEMQIRNTIHYLSNGWYGLQSCYTGHYCLIDESGLEVPRVISNAMMSWMLNNGIVHKVDGEVRLRDDRPEIKFTKR
jgi:hypothetical protein